MKGYTEGKNGLRPAFDPDATHNRIIFDTFVGVGMDLCRLLENKLTKKDMEQFTLLFPEMFKTNLTKANKKEDELYEAFKKGEL